MQTFIFIQVKSLQILTPFNQIWPTSTSALWEMSSRSAASEKVTPQEAETKDLEGEVAGGGRQGHRGSTSPTPERVTAGHNTSFTAALEGQNEERWLKTRESLRLWADAPSGSNGHESAADESEVYTFHVPTVISPRGWKNTPLKLKRSASGWYSGAFCLSDLTAPIWNYIGRVIRCITIMN